jgi:myo-inositol-1(or 4)-monophosphatase
MIHHHFMETAIKAAVNAGTVLVEHYGKVRNQHTKESLRDIVTEVDQLSEAAVISILQTENPEYGILTEEKGFIGPKTSDFWVVDALDGTINYIHNLPLFCVSIAFIKNGKAIVGAIYNPLSEDLYYGGETLGCYKNQHKLAITPTLLTHSLTAAAFSGKALAPQHRHLEYQVFGQVNDASQGCLRTGSAAMNLAYVAEGKLGGCWGKANKTWDIEAGLLLAKLSGAQTQETPIPGHPLLKNYIAAAPTCFDSLSELVSPSLTQ